MKKLTVIALLLAASLFAQEGKPQEDKPVEQTKKNIRVLTGVPSSQLIPIMTVMANSLGVTCAHCHETDWASDAKPAKETARQMIRMTRAINEAHYGGNVVVTCNTCHHGNLPTAPVPLVGDSGWNRVGVTAPPQPPLPRAEELFAKYRQSWGSGTVRNRHSVGVVTGRSGRGEPRSAPFELFQELPGRNELKLELSYPPEADREFVHQFFNHARIRERYASVVTSATEQIRGRAAWVVEAMPIDGGRAERLWFDAATGHLLRRHRERATIVGVLPEEYDFDDYRTVDGVSVPFVLQWSRADYQVTHRLATVQHNVTR